MSLSVQRTLDFIRQDWRSNPLRLCLEVYNWIMNVIIAVIFMWVAPAPPPMIWIYPLFLTTLCVSMYSALSRESFGLFMAGLTIFIIDSIGFIRVLMG